MSSYALGTTCNSIRINISFSLQDDDEAYETEFGDELSFLVENVQLKEQKQSFMPYIY